MDQLNQDKDGKISEIITEIKPEEKSRLEMQAKTFYFCQQTENIMNIEDYEEWKRNRAIAKPEYSYNYQELVELIIAGKEVPGIMQIPDTVLEGESSRHTSQARKKPWEIKREQEEKARKEAAKEAALKDLESNDEGEDGGNVEEDGVEKSEAAVNVDKEE